MTPHIRIVAFAFALLMGTGFVHAQTVSAGKAAGKPLRLSPSAGSTGVHTRTARPAKRVAAAKVPARPAPTAMSKQAKTMSKPVKATSKQIKAKPMTAARKVVARKTIVARKATTKPLPAVGVRRPPAAAAIVREPVSLTPGERSVLYRTIVREQIVPVPVITERIVPSSGEPATAPIVAGPQPTEPIAAGRATTAAAYTVGVQLPANVPLFAIPESAALQVPVVRRYSYAFINDRVLLVEPLTGIVVAELDR
jgi:hypothetical protein